MKMAINIGVRLFAEGGLQGNPTRWKGWPPSTDFNSSGKSNNFS